MAKKVTTPLLYGAKHLNNPCAYRPTNLKEHNSFICAPRRGTVLKNHLTGEKSVIGEGKEIVLSGTVGEISVLSLRKVLSAYAMTDGTSLYNYLTRTFKNKPLIFDWLPVKFVPPVARYHVLFIPEREKFNFIGTDGKVCFVNQPHCSHGGGDFIVCSDLNGRPNLADRRVVNGAIFRNIFTLRGKLSVLAGEKQAKQSTPKSFFAVPVVIEY
ncbi:MAG: hypothetical protein FWH08_00235 [Oscillospiraceae bacterium]|nr:hypothetical protein [Oscillospiraceae bacterium]